MYRADSDSLTGGSREQAAIPFVLMRGGTSKAVFLQGRDLPDDDGLRDATILSLFGSPDRRQVDGLGGADLLTSKLAIIDPPTRVDADLDYTFAQVSITEPVVDYDINCGNISAAVGAFAVDEGLVKVQAPTTTVRIHNTNTGRLLIAEVPIDAGYAAVEGDCEVQGVPGTGAPIALDFRGTGGGITGALLPTGKAADILETTIGPVEATIMDLANLTVFFSAAAVGMAGTEVPAQFDQERLDSIGAVKEAAAKLLGMAVDGLTPVPALVGPPRDYTTFGTGETVPAETVDLVARVVGGRPPVPHKAYPGTLAACTGVAALISGTTVHAVARPHGDGVIRIGHMSGVLPVRARVRRQGDTWSVEQAAYNRTARRLAQGTAYVRRTAIARRDDD
jgi:2-methylaconitate cis-trans-isomerase PrpF